MFRAQTHTGIAGLVRHGCGRERPGRYLQPYLGDDVPAVAGKEIAARGEERRQQRALLVHGDKALP